MSTSAHYATSLSDEQWHVVHLMLPEPKGQPGGPGRPPLDLRRVVDGKRPLRNAYNNSA